MPINDDVARSMTPWTTAIWVPERETSETRTRSASMASRMPPRATGKVPSAHATSATPGRSTRMVPSMVCGRLRVCERGPRERPRERFLPMQHPSNEKGRRDPWPRRPDE